MVCGRVSHIKPDRVVQNALQEFYNSGALRGRGEFQVVTTQSPVQHESFSNSSGVPTVSLEQESIELIQFKIGACSVAKKPPKIR